MTNENNGIGFCDCGERILEAQELGKARWICGGCGKDVSIQYVIEKQLEREVWGDVD